MYKIDPDVRTSSDEHHKLSTVVDAVLHYFRWLIAILSETSAAQCAEWFT